jgi:hypothetical protein
VVVVVVVVVDGKGKVAREQGMEVGMDNAEVKR